MDKKIHCTICGIPLDLDEAQVDNSLELYCKKDWEDWAFELEAEERG
jgi:hypothetical protein